MIIFTDWIPSKFNAMTAWPFIFIRKSSKYDKALLSHEMAHYKDQAWIAPWWLLRYWLSRKFRLRVEAAGYKVQIAEGGVSIKTAVSMLMHYDLEITQEQAEAALKER